MQFLLLEQFYHFCFCPPLLFLFPSSSVSIYYCSSQPPPSISHKNHVPLALFLLVGTFRFIVPLIPRPLITEPISPLYYFSSLETMGAPPSASPFVLGGQG